MRRVACALVLAGVLGLTTTCPRSAQAAPARSTDGLQTSILAPDPGSIGDRMSLDVSFRGGAVATVELYLDNALVAKRQLNTAQTRGVITFTLDTVLLTEGSHDVLVKSYGTDGKESISSLKVRIPAADLSAPVRIVYPQNGVQVSGIVPIRVSLDDQTQKQKPYVTFFINKELKVLRNYPPYEYNWDTTKVQNGWYLLEAWTQTSDAVSPFKARPVHVSVNNAGGETKRQDKVEDLRTQTTPSRPVVLTPETPRRAVDPSSAIAGPGKATPDVDGHAPSGLKSGSRPMAGDTALRSAEPSTFGYGAPSLPKAGPAGTDNNRALLSRQAPRMTGGAVVEPRGRMAVASNPPGLLPGIGQPDPVLSVVPPSRSGFNSTLTVQPGETLEKISRKTGVDSQEIARLNNLGPNGRLRAGRSLIVPRAGSFDVAFDGIRIAFDVAPRIENGVNLAPFRQIFEHTGGRLYWFGGLAQTVRAVNATREIEIKIGDASALVNNQTLQMERKPYIDTGRTIVPLTFIRDALNVRIRFEPTSGRLLIESKK